MRFKILSLLLAGVLLTQIPAFGASFVVPRDAELIRRAHAIVIGSALASYARLNESGGIETVTPFAVEEVIKGEIAQSSTIDVVEPGGVLDGRSTIIAGVPRF